jgi:hypothetical protein
VPELEQPNADFANNADPAALKNDRRDSRQPRAEI